MPASREVASRKQRLSGGETSAVVDGESLELFMW